MKWKNGSDTMVVEEEVITMLSLLLITNNQSTKQLKLLKPKNTLEDILLDQNKLSTNHHHIHNITLNILDTNNKLIIPINNNHNITPAPSEIVELATTVDTLVTNKDLTLDHPDLIDEHNNI